MERYKVRHRITNAVKGWNNRLNTLVGKLHSRVLGLFLCLKREADRSNSEFVKAELNIEGATIKKSI